MAGPQPASPTPTAPPRYREICPLASGGMAELHLARMTAVGGVERLVVVKRVKPQLADSPELAQALLDEARIAATLNHGNIVSVYDVAFEHGLVSVVMEYLHGQDVRTVMRRAGGALPLDQAVAIALGVCAGLHHAHDRVDATGAPLDIVHRDVSADNVVVTYDGGVKLIDFGIARAHSRLGQTDHGVTKGKPGYMAPEQILCTRIDRRTDVHAAAVLLYEMTVGAQPRAGAGVSDYELLNATIERDATPPGARVKGYPPALEAIVMKGLAREPDARWQSALEMQRALEDFARGNRLELSSFALAAVMERLFADRLRAWRDAQKAGMSLEDHVLALRRSTLGVSKAEADEIRAVVQEQQERRATEVVAVTARQRRRPWLAYALLAMVGMIAIGLGVWRTTTTDHGSAPVAKPVVQPAVDTAPALPPPAPAPALAPAPTPAPAAIEAAVPLAPKPTHKPRHHRDERPGSRAHEPVVADPPAPKTAPKTAPTTTPTPPVDPDGPLPR